MPLPSDFLLQMHLIPVLRPVLEARCDGQILQSQFYSLDACPKVLCLRGIDLCQGQKYGALLNVGKCLSNRKPEKDDTPRLY